MTTCQSCGSPIEPGSSFCGVCAAAVPAASVAPVAQAKGALAPDVVHTRETTPPEDSFDYLSRTGTLIQPAASAPAVHSTDQGEPSPAALGIEVAPVGLRFAALVLDGLVSGLLYSIALVLMIVTEQPLVLAVGAALVGVLGLVQWFLEGKTGSTIGARVLRVQVVKAWTFDPPGLWASLLRSLIVSVGSIAFVIGALVVVLSGLFDHGPWQRGWHDRIAKVVVIRRRTDAAAAHSARTLDDLLAPTGPAAPFTAPGAPAGVSQAPAASAAGQPVARTAAAQPVTGWGSPARAETRAPESEILISAVPGFGPPPSAPVAPAPAPAPAAEPAPAAPAPAVPEPEPALVAAPAAAPEPALAPVSTPVAVPSPPPPPPAPAAPAPTPAAPAAVVAPEPAAPAVAAAPAPTVSVDEPITAVEAVEGYVSQDIEDLEHTRISARTHAGPVLVLPGGERLAVRGDGVLGRNPSATEGSEATHLVRIQDRTRTVSKSHVAFGADSVGLWVRDLASTNGTAVRSADGTVTDLEPFVVVHVRAGDQLVLGDDAEVMVE